MSDDPFEHAKRGDVDYFQSLDLYELENSKDDFGNSVLSMAAREDQLSCCQVIYRRCPRLLYKRNKLGGTPLHQASYNGHNEIIKFLLTARATLKQESKCINIDEGVVKTVVDDELLIMVTTENLTALHYAAWNRKLQSAKLLIEADRNKKLLRMVDNDKETALHFAVKNDHLEIVELLVEADPDFEYSADTDGKTPLLMAFEQALSGDPRTVEIRNFLIQRQSSQCAIRTGLNGWTILHHASCKGDLSAMKEIIRSNPSCTELVEADRTKKLLRMVDNNKETALHVAVKNHHLEIVKLLVEADPDFEYSANTNGKTPLLMAFEQALSGDQRTVEIRNFLIQRQSSQCAVRTGLNGWTILHHASCKGDLSAIKEIIRSNPSCTELVEADRTKKLLRMVDNYKETTLHVAVKKHHLEIVKLLVEADPDFEYSANTDGKTPLLMAFEQALSGDQRTVEIRNFLIQRQSSQCAVRTGWKGWTILHHASCKGDLSAIKEIIRSNPSCTELVEADRTKKLLRMVDNDKETALHVAVKKHHLEIVKLLVEADPDFEYSANTDGKTPLLMAFEQALSGDQRTVEIRNFLIQRQSSQCAVRTGLNGWTILHHASCIGDLSAIKEIIRSNPSCTELVEADRTKKLLRMVDNDNETALHVAVKNHHLEIVELLVEADPDFEYSTNTAGKTPLLIAIEEVLSGDQRTVKIRTYLIEKQSRQCMVPTGQEEWTLLHHATSKQELGVMEEIIQSCPDCLTLVDKKGQNFLHLAVSSKHIDVVNYILGNPKIDDSVLNGRDNNGNTPLHLATAGGYVSISLSLLYDSRVRKMIQNNNGKSALDAIDFVYDLSRAKVEGISGLVDLKQLKDQSDFDLLVGALIATVSFTAGITVPGGFFSDGPSRGNAILYKKRNFEVFVVFNTIALALSLFVVLSHFCLRRLVNKNNILLQLQMATCSLIGAIFAMMIAFIMGSFAVLSISPGLSITVCLICCCFFGVSGYCLWMMIGDKVKQRGRNS